jgi:predicted nucleic acid-binding protein
METLALCDEEFISGIRSAVLRAHLSVDRATEAIQDYRDLPLRIHSHRPLLERIWELRNNFSPYDAAYVALAEGLNAEFLTADKRLERSVRSHTSVRVVET